MKSKLDLECDFSTGNFLSQQINMPNQLLLIVLNVFVLNFPDIGPILTNLITVCTIPKSTNVKAFENQFSPSIKNLHVKFFNISSLNIEVIVNSIAIWCKRIGNKNYSFEMNSHITCC